MNNKISLILFLLFYLNITVYTQEIPDFFDGMDEQTYCPMEKAERQIEDVRKSNFILDIVDEEGKRIDASAVIELVSHEFNFGANLYGFHKFEENDPVRAIALKAIDTLFNTLIVCDYWSTNQKDLTGSLNWESPDYGFKIAEELSKTPRYHALIYGFPKWLHNFETEEELWEIIENRIKNVADRYGNLISEVDVINEFINYQYWDQNPNAQYLKTTNFPDFAKPENGLRVLQIAKKYLPDARLVVLETGIWSLKNPVFQEIYEYHKSLIKLGAPDYYIGYQAHYYAQKGMPFEEGTPDYGPRTFMMDEINKGLEKMGSLGLPMLITEFNPPSRNNKIDDPDQPGLSDEEIAAWEVAFYTLVFSKPYMKGLSRWFTIDNLGGRGMDAGIITENGELKPNYFALRNLINEKWHSRWQGNIKKQLSFSGFDGYYNISVEGYKIMKVRLFHGVEKQTIHLVSE